MGKVKSFDIPKREVWEAFKRVKANQGAAGVDGQSIAEFEANLSGNLYKLWNRLSSGSYFPPPVRRVDIPKADGGTRPLGIPTVADRVAQEVARRCLEPILEPVFHADSYGYRPGKSAIDAVRQARQRCWRCDWVLDLDVRAFFDSIDWELLLKAVRQHTDCPWVLLYVERWLKAPVQMEDGSVVPRTAGTPQGGVISPLLANLFLHYAFDTWMARNYPHSPFERYADDAICHCQSAKEARALWSALADRLAVCKLVLHPVKTKIVYCKDANRRGDFPIISFDFLGFQFRARKTIWNGKAAHGFMPAASPKALTALSRIFSTPPTRPQPGETPPTHFGLEKAPAVGYRMGLSISKSFFRALHDPYSIGRGRLTRRSDSLAPIRLIRHGGQDRNPLDAGHECCVWSLTIFHRFCSFNAPSNKSFQRSAG